MSQLGVFSSEQIGCCNGVVTARITKLSLDICAVTPQECYTLNISCSIAKRSLECLR